MSPPSHVKIAIVGTGLIGPRHAEAVVKSRHAILSCIVDPNPAAGETIARKFGCPWYNSVEEMLGVGVELRPDAALVCTPNHTHVSISMVLLKNGVHVLCEKPISVDVESGRELVTCAEASRAQLLIGHHRRFNRYVLAAKNILPSLGKIVAVSGLWTAYKPSEYFDPPTDWRRLDTAGPILINIIHDIDILHFLFGPVTRVFAEQAISQRGYAAEEGAAVTLRFASGLVGTFVLADAVVSPHSFESGTGENPMIAEMGRDCYRIFGSEGSLSFPDMMNWTYPGQPSWSETLDCQRVEVAETKAPFELQIEHFVKVIKNKEEPSCTGRVALRAVQVCEAIKKSMRDKLPVEIPLEE